MKRGRLSSYSAGKRARSTAVALRGRVARTTTTTYRRKPYVPRFRRGTDRTGGFYGRYAPLGDETKFFDTTLSFLIDSTSEVPATGQLVLIPQGVTESTRVGRKCVVKSISIRMSFTFVPAAAATASVHFRICLILDKQCNGAAAVASDVFTADTMVFGFRNMSNSSRFQVLKSWDRIIEPGAGVTTAYNNSRLVILHTKPCNIPLEFSSTTGAITELKSNNLFLLAQSVGGDDLVQVAGASRVRFTDT